jgi:hypothetical protein
MANVFETTAAKVAGKTAAVEARIKGLKGVFTKLAEQHHTVGVLLTQAAGTTDPVKRRELWSEIRVELMSHEQAELLEIYPLLETYSTTSDITPRHGDQASELEGLIREVDLIATESDAWRAALARLNAKVKEHVEQEEKDFFPRAQAALGDEATKQLEPTFLRAQEMAKSRLA